MPEKVLHTDVAAPEDSGLSPLQWAGVPDGFEVLGLASRARAIALRRSSREALLSAGIQDPATVRSGPLVVGWLEGGRTRHALIRSKGEEWVLKAYRRGGFVGRWNSERYWGSGRFLEELRIAALAERSGVATAEALALIVERAGLGSVRAWLVTRYLERARPLTEFFGDAAEVAIFRAAGEVVRRMHLAGIDHHDLHLGNIMGSFEEGRPKAHIVDWDRARLRAPGTWSPYGNLSRLWRSLEKGRLHADFGALRRPVRAFIRGYFAGHAADLRDARRFFRNRAICLGLHRWYWRAGR